MTLEEAKIHFHIGTTVYLKDNIIPHDWLNMPGKIGSFPLGNLKLKEKGLLQFLVAFNDKDVEPGYVPIFYEDSNGISCQVQVRPQYLSLYPWSSTVTDLKIPDYGVYVGEKTIINNNLKPKTDGDIIKVQRPDCQIGRSEKVRGSILASRRI